MKKDYYEILGVPKGATLQDIKNYEKACLYRNQYTEFLF